MNLKFLLDVQVPRPIRVALREFDVVAAREYGAETLPDDALLDLATAENLVLVTQDQDFLREGARPQKFGVPFPGIIFAPQRVPVSELIEDLRLIAQVESPEDFLNRVVYLPLK